VNLPEQLYDQDYLTGLSAVGADDLFVVGFDIDTGANPYDGWIMRRSGESWLPTERLTGFGWLNGVHGLGPLGPAWVVGTGSAKLDGASWTIVPTGTEAKLEAVWVSAADSAWAVSGFAVMHWDGAAWSNGMLSVARYGPTKTTIIPIGEIYAASEPEPKIVGAGNTVWVKWFHNLVRYRHDPDAVFP
jgi:hypothetical protein